MQSMTSKYVSTEIVKNGKTLILLIANFQDEHPTINVENIVTSAFDKISPYLQEELQTLYIRDNADLCLKDGFYWKSDCSSPYEATIAMPRWGDDEFQIKHLTLAIHQTLYSLARRQHLGGNALFGDEVLSRGLAAYYAHAATGYEWPSALNAKDIQKPFRTRMIRYWFRWYDSVHKNWLPDKGDLLIATEVGYELADMLCGGNNAEVFSLGEAMKLHGWRFADKLWVLNHPKSRRSARIMEYKAHRPTSLLNIRNLTETVLSL